MDTFYIFPPHLGISRHRKTDVRRQKKMIKKSIQILKNLEKQTDRQRDRDRGTDRLADKHR